jgi:phenylalanyl-tRNA synthetase beta chain
MKVSLSWLKDYVDVDIDVNRLADALTMAGLEVSSAMDRYAYLDRVVVGKIVAISPHPNADTLSICDVEAGDGRRSIVCGAPNIRVGNVVPVALPGTELPTGITVQEAAICGEMSHGMLCSESELGLGDDTSGVRLLSHTAQPGTPIKTALNLSDTMMEFDLTPNRSDCFSFLGIAREIAAILGKDLHYPKIQVPAGDRPISEQTSVIIKAPDHCFRYAARLISGVNIGPSPSWLRHRLESIGLRPINNVVDVTNFVLMEYGQPLHAFDFDRLEEHRIVVRTAEEGEQFTTLDGVERKLSSDMLVICDSKKPVALAGIMGGLNSEIAEDTSNILIESAYFNPISIRRAAKRLGLKTESSHRFERGVDPASVIRALDRAAQLMLETAGGNISEGVIDEYPRPISQRVIPLSVPLTNRLLGTKLSTAAIADHLRSIDLNVKICDDDHLEVIPPTFRIDLKHPVDLMEEVARLEGYDRIPTTYPIAPVISNKPNQKLPRRKDLFASLVGCGFSQIITYSFIDEGSSNQLLLSPDDRRRRIVRILNPLTEDQTVMRTSLIPGLLNTMVHNQNQNNNDLRIFELGKVFFYTEEDALPEEVEMIAGLWTGSRQKKSWHFGEIMVDFYDIKGIVEEMLGALNVPSIRFQKPSDEARIPYLRRGYSAEIFSGKTYLGEVGEVSVEVLRNFDLKKPAFIFDLNFDILMTQVSDSKGAHGLSRFPAISRDLALILDASIEARRIIDYLKGLGEKLIEDIEIFDVYQGKPIPQGKKSVAFRIIYRSPEKTLEDRDVNDLHALIGQKVLRHFKTEFREETSPKRA